MCPRQGCVLSPLLFNLYGEYIMRRTLQTEDGNAWDGGVPIGGVRVSNLRYADDTTLVTTNVEDMSLILGRLEEISAEYGLTINKAKTKVMIINRPEDNCPGIRELGDIEVVNRFAYLGSIIENNGGCEAEVQHRIQITRSAMGRLKRIWADSAVSKALKIRLVNTLVFSVFLYGSETWSLRQADRKRIDALEMWCWRRLLRIPWTARRTNVSVLKEVGVRKRLSTIVLGRMLSYFGHVMRAQKMETLFVQGKVDGKRGRDRSPTRWTDAVRKSTGRTFQDCVRIAHDRTRWRRVVSLAIDRQERSHDTSS